MNKEEAIKQLEIILQNIIEERKQGITSTEGIKFQEALQTILNLIQKQDKIIDKMAEQLAGLVIWNDNIQEPLILGDKEEVKEYYKKELEKC